MRDKIEIEKDLIPYSFEILLADDTFELEINYNETADLFTITLYKQEEVIVYDEPIIYGIPLFKDVFQAMNFPALDIIPLDESNNVNTITWDNFNELVFLCIDNK